MKLQQSKSFRRWLSQPIAAPTTTVAPTDAALPVLVVGAGPAGLAAMAGLKQAGVAFQGVESHSRVGGIWDQSNPLSSVYDGMLTNTSRQTTHLGPAMPTEWPDYPSAGQARTYLADFSQQHQLDPHIQCSTRFENARKSPRGTWIVTLQRDAEERPTELEYRAVVFATGVHHQQRRVIPQQLWDEAVAAGLETLHSSQYRSAADFAGKRVLIVGIGNSGSDIADIISRTAERTVLAVRSTPWIVPSVVFGRPSDQLADDTTNWLPYWIQLASFQFIQRLYIGHPRKLGLDTPQYELLEKFAVTDRGFVEAVREGRVVLRSNVTSLKDGVATFAKSDHAPEPFDAVIFATGYNRRYPLLDDPSDGKQLADSLSFLIFHRTEPGLAYMSETIATRGCWPIFAEQGKAMAAYFAAEQRDGQSVSAFNARRSLPSPDFKGKLFSKSDSFHVDYHLYTQALLNLRDWLAS
jgi:cation diffusion facilitator CzcD-associated flavoprotein CzcO